MAAEITQITDSNQDLLIVMMSILSELSAAREDIAALHTEQHEAVRIGRKLESLLDQYRPLLDRYATPAGAYMAARQARRRAVPQNGQGQVPQP